MAVPGTSDCPLSWIITGTAVLSVYFILRGKAYKRFMKKA